MSDTSKTPLWLDIKKEYIDDNFEKFLAYLRDNISKHDSFYETSASLLNERAELAIATLSARPLHDDESETADSTFNIRLLAAWILTNNATHDTRRALLAIAGELRKVAPKFSEQLLTLSVDCLRHEGVENPGFRWDDIIDFKPEVFAFKTLRQTTFAAALSAPAWCHCNGTVCVTGKSLSILAANSDNAPKQLATSVASLELPCGINISTDNISKLKQSKHNDIVAIGDFLDTFIASLRHVKTPQARQRLKIYGDDTPVDARVTDITDTTITVETTDPRYERLCGPLVYKLKSLLYYYTDTFSKHLRVGDIIPVDIVDAEKQTFTIDRTFVAFIVEDCREDHTGVFLSKLIDNSQKRYNVWLTLWGTPVYVEKQDYDDYQKNELAYLEITKFQAGPQYGMINGRITDVAERDANFYEPSVRRECIRAFTREPETFTPSEPAVRSISPDIPRLLVRHIFAHQRHILKPSERAAHLADARALAEVVGDTEASEYIDFAYSYLRALILFVRDEKLDNVTLTLPDDCREAQTAQTRVEVVRLLKLWGSTDGDETLNAAIQRTAEAPMLARVAKLIQVSNSMREIVTGASLTVIRREIIKTLCLETEQESDLEADDNAYLGVESGTMEFKESVVFPPDNNMQADEARQIRNVLKGVCAFLNSTSGGTLYVGVTDQGYVKGIKNDMAFLHLDNIDTYMRYHIQDPAKLLLGLDVLPNIQLEPMYDNQVVAIRVTPSRYRIVELEGKAYIRVNAESREMSDTVRQQQTHRKIEAARGIAANLATLTRAQQERRRVVLHNCAADGTVADITCEAYDIRPEHNLFSCFDTISFKCRLLSISSIGYIEITDTPWQRSTLHRSMPLDAFHTTGEKTTDCCLQLDMFAKNNLLEHYPAAKPDLTSTTDPNLWYFNTKVYDIAGIARFYIGLADHISIVNAPELSAYARKFADRHLRD